MCAQFFFFGGGTPGMIYGGMWMPLAFALHHEQNMPAVKSKIYPASHTRECTKSYFIYMCNVWQVSGCKWKTRWLFGRSRTLKYGLFRWEAAVFFAACANGTLPKSSGLIRRVCPCVCAKPFGDCKVNYKLSGQTLCLFTTFYDLFAISLCVLTRFQFRFCLLWGTKKNKNILVTLQKKTKDPDSVCEYRVQDLLQWATTMFGWTLAKVFFVCTRGKKNKQIIVKLGTILPETDSTYCQEFVLALTCMASSSVVFSVYLLSLLPLLGLYVWRLMVVESLGSFHSLAENGSQGFWIEFWWNLPTFHSSRWEGQH